MSAGEDLDGFIRDTFRSVWALELLLHHKRTRDRTWSSSELVRELRSSEHVVTTAGGQLVAAGLLIQNEDRDYGYAPASADLACLVDAAEAAYATSPNAVRRMIVSSPNIGLTAFADAFRLRKE